MTVSVMPKKTVLFVRDIQSMIYALGQDIEREKNTKEKARLVDEQAALKLTLRLVKSHKVGINYK